MGVDLQKLHREMTEWRHHLHSNPEFGFEEVKTAAFVASKLREFGLDEVVEGVGGTGVVGTLKRGTSNRAVALRADMDALRIPEATNLPYKSQNPGLMHACGHEGHTTMLLGAAKMLAEEGGFDGTVRFFFQPAEEWGKGALAMLADGLSERFPYDEIFGIHNAPGMPLGSFEAMAGPVTASEDNFEIVLSGLGGHASRPQNGQEVLVAACALVTSLQTIVSRRLSPADIAVVSVTELVTDGTRNTLPGTARIAGDTRSFRDEVSADIEKQMRIISHGIAQAYSVTAEVKYTREFIPTVNDAELVEASFAAARKFLGPDQIRVLKEPNSGSEDFAQFLDRAPGCFVFLGNGEDSLPLHNPGYNFNDELLPVGARLHSEFARERLPLA